MRRIPNRSCVACRSIREKRDLLRIVAMAGGVTIDPGGRAPGRGAYVCRTAECMDTAIRKGALNRALRTPLPAELRIALTDQIADATTTSIEGGIRGQE